MTDPKDNLGFFEFTMAQIEQPEEPATKDIISKEYLSLIKSSLDTALKTAGVNPDLSSKLIKSDIIGVGTSRAYIDMDDYDLEVTTSVKWVKKIT